MSGVEKENAPRRETGGAQENGDSVPCRNPSNIPGIGSAGDGNCLVPSKEEVRAALRLIHAEGPWHVSAKREKGFTGAVFAPDADSGAAGWAVAKNRTLNTYVSIAALRPGFRGDKATKADVASVGWLWVDLDPRPGEELELERARILALLTTNLPKGVLPPSVIIDSGRGRRLTTALTVTRRAGPSLRRSATSDWRCASWGWWFGTTSLQAGTGLTGWMGSARRWTMQPQTACGC
ncbi:hypothetical protein [Paracoccus aminovorans]|uniref:hypothetical protein n=1 Tax=Paracoccus aminovorans TaxID=34004 RepID=UPI002B25FB07|nr:hypothetical protein [Paracoccus aminovorans]